MIEKSKFWGLILWLGLSWGCSAGAGEEIWLLVDTKALTLYVKQGEKDLAVFENIAIGRGGVTQQKRQGDNKTPLGEFHIGWVKENSRYHRFFGLNYPTIPFVKYGQNAGLIDNETFRSLLKANFEEAVPSQNTPLGGYIGIHGLGRADARIHGLFNWTRGCIALTNEQIDQLSQWVGKGTRVVIR
ncbi:MAG TPA: murein L,D-transpeptidase [Methylothermaceae bacterium]|nr:murein L,D-transpeptidase [Methylothermaceae bacterium]